MIKILKRLGAYMGKRKPLLPLSVFLSAIDGLLALVPFILLWLIIRNLLMGNTSTGEIPIWQYALAAFIISIIDIIIYFAALMLSHLTAFRIEATMRQKAMTKIMKAPLGFFDSQNTGKIRKIIDENASSTHTFVAHILPDLASSFVTPIGVIILIIAIDWRLGLLTLVPIIFAFSTLGYMMNSSGKEFQRMYLDAQEKMSSEAVEYVRGIPVVKVFQQTIFSFKRFYNSILEYREKVIPYTRIWRNPMSAYTVAINSFVFLLVPAGIIMIGHGEATGVIISDIMLYILITPIVALNIMKSMYLSQNMFLANEAVDRVEKLTDIALLKNGSKEIKPNGFDIKFENVTFKYAGATKNTISNISFQINEGKTTALVGVSGSGKTTIARLIPRFWDILEGKISIGGVDVRDFDKEELMKYVSFVFQNIRLFKMSLLDNVRYGNPNASIEDVNRAIDLSGSREIIDKLPKGLDTIIGSEGTYLSGGEQQRIILARAILKNAPIIILDEATAFADPENEYQIRTALKHLTKGKTVLMIAHRLTSINDADNIVVLENGKIKESGTHTELIEQKGAYYGMWTEYQKAIAWKL